MDIVIVLDFSLCVCEKPAIFFSCFLFNYLINIEQGNNVLLYVELYSLDEMFFGEIEWDSRNKDFFFVIVMR